MREAIELLERRKQEREGRNLTHLKRRKVVVGTKAHCQFFCLEDLNEITKVERLPGICRKVGNRSSSRGNRSQSNLEKGDRGSFASCTGSS